MLRKRPYIRREWSVPQKFAQPEIARSGGPPSHATTAARSWRRELLLIPLLGPCPFLVTMKQLGGLLYRAQFGAVVAI